MSKLEDLVKVTKLVDSLEMMRVTSDIKIENDECVISFKHKFRKSEYVQVNFHDRQGSEFGSMIPCKFEVDTARTFGVKIEKDQPELFTFYNFPEKLQCVGLINCIVENLNGDIKSIKFIDFRNCKIKSFKGNIESVDSIRLRDCEIESLEGMERFNAKLIDFGLSKDNIFKRFNSFDKFKNWWMSVKK